MHADSRRAVAYIVGRLVTGKSSSSVYDYEAGSHVSFSGDVTPSAISVYDYEQGCHVGGSPGSLHHYGDGAHISLEVKGTSFSGYDYGTGDHYSGQVSGNSVSLYDYGTGQHYSYSI